MPRGGKRQGTPGKAYGQRTDLQAVKVAPGQQYGKATEQRKAQQAVPMAGATSPGPPPAPQPAPVGPTSMMPGLAQMPAQAPGSLTPLDAPSTRPNEPLTAGMAMGPGAGPEVLGALHQSEDGVEDLAMYLPMLEYLASQPGTSAQTRNFVRKLRGAAPVK